MLSNPDFNNEFDPAPYVELDGKGMRRRSDFMSGDFGWRQCVRLSLYCLFSMPVLTQLAGYYL